MTEDAQLFVLGVFLIFSRIGGVLLVLPGVSSTQVPIQYRLFIAIALSTAFYPAVQPLLPPIIPDQPAPLFAAIGAELLNGVMIGLPFRFLFSILNFIGESLTLLIGLSPVPGLAMEDPAPTLAGFFTASATALFFALDLHGNVMAAMLGSYAIVPVGEFLDPTGVVARLSDAMSEGWALALSLIAPFLIFSVTINLVAGLLNRLTPQIPVYFIITPFLIGGGIVMLYWTADDVLVLFMRAVDALQP